MTKRYGINSIETYVKTKCEYTYIDAIRTWSLHVANKSEKHDINDLYIIEIAALLLLISKEDIIRILTIIGFDHKFINVILQTVKNVSLENNMRVETYKYKGLINNFPAIRYVQAGLNIWKKMHPNIILV